MKTKEQNESGGAYLICGLFALVLACYTLIALISYLFTWAQDQSVFSNEDIFGSLVEVENGGGKIGLVWANFLVSKLFGLGAFIIPLFFLGVFLFCLKIKKVKLLKLFFVTLFGCIILSVLCSFIFSFTGIDRLFGTSAGGSYGYHINNWLKMMIGIPGTAALLIVAVVGWLTIVNAKLIKKISDKISNSAVAPAAGEPTAKEEPVKEEPVKQVPVIEPLVEVAPVEDLPIEEAPKEEAPGRKADTEELTIEEQKENGGELLGQYSEEDLRQTFDPRLELSHYQAPTLDLLDTYRDKWYEVSREEIEKNNRQIQSTLRNYKIEVAKVSARKGPTVTLYEVVPAPGVRVSQIKKLEQDIQLSLAAKGVRVVMIPGSNAVGIEVANEKPSVVSMLSCLEYLQTKIKEPGSKEAKYELPVAIGKTISNDVFTFDLAKCPHLLMAGATGQGKSVGLNALIASILYTKHPSEVKFVMVDPKKVELSLYSRLEKYFLASLPDEEEPVITDTKKVINTLRSLCQEMDTRYELLKLAGVRNIKEYNEKFLSRSLSPAKGHRYLPYIILVIDEYCDLMLTAGKDIELPLTRLAQLARAIGIHLVIATQRPTTTVITGNIKANFPTRIAFYVRSSIDSRTILDEVGANQLIGRGDMLYATGSDVIRLQCALIETKEVDRVVSYIAGQVGYSHALFLPEVQDEEQEEADFGRGEENEQEPLYHKDSSRGGIDRSVGLGEVNLKYRDEYFDDAARLVLAAGGGSASFLQRKINLGYNRASKIIDQLEQAGLVGPADGSKPRQPLVLTPEELEKRLQEIKEQYG